MVSISLCLAKVELFILSFKRPCVDFMNNLYSKMRVLAVCAVSSVHMQL